MLRLLLSLQSAAASEPVAATWQDKTAAAMAGSARFRPIVSRMDCYWRLWEVTPVPLRLTIQEQEEALQAASTAAVIGWEQTLYAHAMAAPRLRRAYTIGRALTGGGLEVRSAPATEEPEVRLRPALWWSHLEPGGRR